MAISLTKALLAYDRLDTAFVNCGGDWVVEIKPFSSVIKELSRQQAKLRSTGVIKDKKKKDSTTQSVALANPTLADLMGQDEDDQHLLGSYEADIKFFVHNVIVGWEGLADDEGIPVEFSTDAALGLFLNNGEPAKRLYRELLACTLDTARFVKTIEEQAEEDTKN